MTKPHNRITFEVSGNKISSFVSRCAEQGVILYDVTYVKCDRPTLRVTVGAGDIRKLIKTAGRCRLHIRERKRYGVYFTAKKAVRRYVLCIGAVIAMTGLFVASNFVWTIKVEGTFNTDEEHILQILNDVGIHRFMFSDRQFLNEQIRTAAAEDKDIASMTGTIKGVVLFVKVNEAMTTQVQKDDGTTALYAGKRGVIEEVYTYSGRAVVKPGDTVREGDLLITGYIESDERNYYTAAKGKVTAKVGYTFAATAPKLLPGKVRTGNEVHTLELDVFGLKLAKKAYADSESVYTDREAIIPLVKVRELTEYELADGYVQATESGRREYARALAEEKMKRGLNPDARIISKSTSYETDADGNITAVISVVTREEIANW